MMLREEWSAIDEGSGHGRLMMKKEVEGEAGRYLVERNDTLGRICRASRASPDESFVPSVHGLASFYQQQSFQALR